MQVDGDIYFALTVPGLEHIAAKDILYVLKFLGKQQNIIEEPFVDPNFLSGQIYFYCSRLIDPNDIIRYVQTVEAICASVTSLNNISNDKMEALHSFVHAPYHWDDDRFDRACRIWNQTRNLRITYDVEGNKDPQEIEYDFRPILKRCNCPLSAPSPESANPFNVNQLISQEYNPFQNKEEDNHNVSITTENVTDVPIPPKIDLLEVKGKFNMPSELINKIKNDYKEGKEIDKSVKDVNREKTPSFRVTGHRCGKKGDKKQTYTSVEMAKYVGGGIFQRYPWQASMENYDIQIYAQVHHQTLLIGILISPCEAAMHRKSRVAFGSTALKPR